ncbi:hypothetical protein KSS87_014583 [Heliosperma pusillum]|nr:hypothetical protein KSS87_003313 [Heliosperma pusillum]KAH9626668.1 hypothetical protein KSS87_014583 [Heliosperma pusillum]
METPGDQQARQQMTNSTTFKQLSNSCLTKLNWLHSGTSHAQIPGLLHFPLKKYSLFQQLCTQF